MAVLVTVLQQYGGLYCGSVGDCIVTALVTVL